MCFFRVLYSGYSGLLQKPITFDFITGDLMKQILIALTLLYFSLALLSCKKDNPVIPPIEPPVLKDTVTVSVEGVTHRSVELRVQSTVNNDQLTIEIYRTLSSKDTLLSSYPITRTDTTIIDDDNGEGLLLDTEYKYYAVTRDSTGEIKDTSNTVSARTLAPTSHDYTWRETTIGDFGSVLYDVWGTDENNVYAVGIININGDSYGVIHFDGAEWYPIEDTVGGTAIFGFKDDDIWVAGGGVYYFNGNNWRRIDAKSINNQLIPLDTVLFYNAPYTSLWGTSSNDMYLGSTWGKIVHWDGNKAEVIGDLGTWITDINGTNEENIWVTAVKSSELKDIILHFDGIVWNQVNLPTSFSYLRSVLPFNKQEVLVGGNGMFYRQTNSEWSILPYINRGSIQKIRGNSSTDLLAVGGYGTVTHYNGIDLHFYDELFTPSGGINYGVYTTGNKVFIVGIDESNTKAQIIIGERN